MNYAKGDRVRVRRQGTSEKWCMCRVDLVSPNGMSMGLSVEDGAVRTENGGIITGFLPVSLMRGEAVDIATRTKLEIELIDQEMGI
jgi:hypothetical protein